MQEESTKRYVKKNADNAKECILHSNFNLRVKFYSWLAVTKIDIQNL